MAKKVDVLFINPGDPRKIYQNLSNEFSALEPPLFCGLYANFVRKKGYTADIYDAPAMSSTAESTAQVVASQYDPFLVVIVVYGQQPSASTQLMGSAGRIATQIKTLAPHIPILMLGTHPAALPEQTMKEESIDFVCSGEGPWTIVKTLQALQKCSSDFSEIPDLWWRKQGRIIPAEHREPLIQNLDAELPGIAWDLLPMDRYRAHNWHCLENLTERAPYASIHTSLGCPYRCSFCCINAPFGKPSYRMWSPDQVVAEIDHLVSRYGVKNIKIADEMFVLNKAHVTGICQLLVNRGYSLNIWAYARVDTIMEDEVLLLMRKAGIRWLSLGIESASNSVRDGANKHYSNQDIKEVVERIKAAGISVMANYVFGLPDDTLERMQQTLELALELQTEFANFYSVMAYPGSKLFHNAVEQKIPLPEKWEDFAQHGLDCRPLPNAHLSSSQILEFRDQAFLRYFTDHRYLEMIRNRFGEETRAHIQRMTSVPLRRRGKL